MKQLTMLFILLVLIVLTTNQSHAQLERNTEYNFKYAAAIKGNDINHVQSNFTFTMVDMELFWQEAGGNPINLGKAYFLGKYEGDEGYAAMYQLNEVKVEYARDSHGVAISIIYGNKRITFHNYQGKPIGDIVKL